MPVIVSNPRDLLVLLLGEILHVERRLAGDVLQSLIDEADDDELRSALQAHLEETRTHVERVETVFRRIEVAPSALLSRSFESAVAQNDERAGSIREPRLACVFRTQAALHTEHWELAAYATALAIGEAMGLEDELAQLRATMDEEAAARDRLVSIAERLARQACRRD